MTNISKCQFPSLSDKRFCLSYRIVLFKIKKIRTRNPNRIITGNLNIDSLPNKVEQLKDIVVQHIDTLFFTKIKLGNPFLTAEFFSE